jgi:Tfp pilus tip-associated adhesin PilY1
MHTKLPLKANAVTSNTIESIYTPLADSLMHARNYFDAYINTYKGGDAATLAQCRGNYVILLTDGLESCRFLDSPKNLFPDYGAAAREAARLMEIGVKAFVIGFGKDIKGNQTLNSIAQSGGTDQAYFAENAAELRDAFKTVFQAIAGNYSRSNPVVTRDVDRLYRSYLSLPGWQGHLVAYEVNEKGELVKKLWDAGEIMNSRGRGNVYTWPQDNKEPKREKFEKASAKRIKEHLNPSSKDEDIDEDGKKDEKDAETIIEFILDPKHNNGKHKGHRSPDWKLGDIYHSSPVIVGKPAFKFPDDLFPNRYSDFKKANENRPTFIYVGANDGMLHVFDDTGAEKFAAIPKNVLGNLKDLRLGHRFYIDASPTAYDVYLRKEKNDWRTIVMSGERSGGTYYFAIDVTNPDDPDQLWELTDTNMGMTWSRPEIGRVKIAGVEKFVAFVGGGYSLSDALGNAFYVIDIDEGVILKKFIVGNSTNKVPAGARAFDRDLDGRVDGVYFGDIQGTLWKIKIDGNENAEDWKLIELFKSDGMNPIFYPPAVTRNNQGKVLVYFGTGDELNLFDTKQYAFYEIWDKGEEGEMIWGFPLPGRGEKVLAAPAISNNVIYFTTWENTETVENCGAGKARLYGLTSTRQGTQGGLPALYFDIKGTQLDKPVPSLEIGIGIPSAPVVTNGTIYVSSSFNADKILGIKIPPWGKGKLKSWREVF